MTAVTNKDLNRSTMALPDLCNYIDGGTSVPAIDRGNCLPNPNNQQEIQTQRSCSQQQVETALASAAEAFDGGEWESTPAWRLMSIATTKKRLSLLVARYGLAASRSLP
jgi:hypothetical protein